MRNRVAGRRHVGRRGRTHPQNGDRVGEEWVLDETEATRASFRIVRTLVIIAVIAGLTQPALNIAFVFIQPERSPLSEPNSDYALGRLGWLWQLGAIAAGISSLALAAGFRMSLAPGKKVRLFLALIVLSGLGVIGTGVFISGDPLHLLFGLVGFIGIVVSAFVAKGVFARDPRWQPLARLTRWIAWYSVFLLPALIAAPASITGLVERLFPAPLAIWDIAIVWRMYQLGPVPTAPQANAQPV